MKALILITVLFACMALSNGCIVIPTSGNKVMSGEEVPEKELYFVYGITSKHDVISLLGSPNVILIDENIFVYDWKTRQSIIVFIIPGAYQGYIGYVEIPENHLFLIQFNSKDKVEEFKFTVRPWHKSYGDHVIEWIQKNE